MGECRVRIVAGEFKGRVIEAPKGRDTRPTGDRVRESMMSAISSRLGGFAGETVLDAFAGSGALGLEALSRGAEHATFFEVDRKAQDALVGNIAALGVRDRTTLVRGDIVRAADRNAIPNSPFTLLFLDPPYRLGRDSTFALMSALAKAGVLAQGALVVYEASFADQEVDAPPGFSVETSRRMGDTTITMLVFESDER